VKKGNVHYKGKKARGSGAQTTATGGGNGKRKWVQGGHWRRGAIMGEKAEGKKDFLPAGKLEHEPRYEKRNHENGGRGRKLYLLQKLVARRSERETIAS